MRGKNDAREKMRKIKEKIWGGKMRKIKKKSIGENEDISVKIRNIG